MTKTAVAAPAEFPSAVRTVSETDDVRIIEGLAYPFKGRDTYGTFFSARTDFHWDLFPDVNPAVRGDAAPQFVRPTSFHHGFDPEMGLVRIGGWSPIRTDADGVWVQAQIDKRNAFYATRIQPLLDAGALGLSGGSAEHSIRIDQRSGEILDWPAYELALTPTESNPLAQIAARAGEMVTIIAADATRRDISAAERKKIPAEDFAGPDDSFPIAEPEDVAAAAHSVGRAADSDAVKAKIISIAKRKGDAFVAQLPDAWKAPAAKSAMRFSEAASDASSGANVLATMYLIAADEADEPDQMPLVQAAIDSWEKWLALESDEIGTPDDMQDSGMAYMSGVRAGGLACCPRGTHQLL